jgi:hypothetical protein
MDRSGKMYLALLAIALAIAGIISLYTLVKNYLRDRNASKRKVIFKKENGVTKGYWKTKQGEEYDEDLKIED